MVLFQNHVDKGCTGKRLPPDAFHSEFPIERMEAPAVGMKRKYSVEELTDSHDPKAPMPADLVAWDTMVPVGLECDIEISEEEGAFVARCPVPEVASDGKSPEEALANLREALNLFFERKFPS